MTLAVWVRLHLDVDHLEGLARLAVTEADESGVGHCEVRWRWLDVHQAAVLHDEPGSVAVEYLASVLEGRRSGVGTTSGELDVPKGHPAIELP